MGVDAQLYAAAAASQDQSPRTQQQSGDVAVTVHGGSTVATDAVTQNGMKAGTQQEGVYIIYCFIPAVMNGSWSLKFPV